jgi:DNA repair exonuclease SbcCD ATPase subunit
MQRIARKEIEEAARSLASVETALKEAAVAKESAVSRLVMKENDAKDLIGELEDARSMWGEKISTVEKDLTASRNERARLFAQIASAAKAMQQEAITKSKEDLLLEEKRAVQSGQSLYQDLCASVEKSEARLQELRASGEAQRSLSVTMTNLADVFGARGIQTFLLQSAIDMLQSVAQLYLDELSDGSQRLELKLDAGDRISRKASIRGPDGEFIERPLSSLSGGQWRRCSLALSLGFADLVSRRGRMKTSLCVLDEPLTHLDRSGRSRVGTLLRGLLQQNGNGVNPISLNGGMGVSTILVILQDLAAEELEESFDHIDEVVKVDGRSTVKLDK